MTFDPQAPGNKGVPEPKAGYEQRKVLFEKYQDAIAKGWLSRLKDTGERYMTQGCVIMERKLAGYVEPTVADSVLPDVMGGEATVTQGETIASLVKKTRGGKKK